VHLGAVCRVVLEGSQSFRRSSIACATAGCARSAGPLK
jgi:hypothetical protein